MPDTATPFRIGVPSKGRLSELAEKLLNEAGLKYRRQNRALFARVKPLADADPPIDITFLRTDDIPVLCDEGAIDLGITGSDLVAEADVANIETRLSLGMGGCRLAVCVPESSPVVTPKDLAGDRVATSFPTVTRNYLNEHGVTGHVVELSGSVEVMIALGVADAIVDLVETGSTLAANKLRILDTIGSYETVLIQRKRQRLPKIADRIARRLEGVVIARAYTLLEYNVPEAKLAAAEAVTPGFNSPTVNKLEQSGWFAVRAMVKRSEVIGVMERLEELGAHAILETAIQNCRL
ncbi:ATP phosphoribosyltransferase [Pseudobythopirellula maris]|uniref:ATP phosphoribosyltransferase n=1 Tax=Pseudobythopirellula maris TaxID=2527991 RepID=A0A5C5ZN63_9BACT|nr:ATP phosphoribosyltransferase [Pseudobythopirellula maris]TWT88598.1 ATP phosphoribosyltransferase [Pseudobythopirellula maris]